MRRTLCPAEKGKPARSWGDLRVLYVLENFQHFVGKRQTFGFEGVSSK
jgi:hypothetical protein